MHGGKFKQSNGQILQSVAASNSVSLSRIRFPSPATVVRQKNIMSPNEMKLLPRRVESNTDKSRRVLLLEEVKNAFECKYIIHIAE